MIIDWQMYRLLTVSIFSAQLNFYLFLCLFFFVVVVFLVPIADRLYQDLFWQSMSATCFLFCSFVFFHTEQRAYVVNVDGTRS